MTNEEKFNKGIVIYKTDNDVICELWGASTKHADVIYSMNRDIKNDLFTKCQFADNIDHDIFQWLLYVASRQVWKTTAKEIVEIALAEWYNQKKFQNKGLTTSTPYVIIIIEKQKER